MKHLNCQNCTNAEFTWPTIHSEPGPDDVAVTLPCGANIGIPLRDVQAREASIARALYEYERARLSGRNWRE